MSEEEFSRHKQELIDYLKLKQSQRIQIEHNTQPQYDCNEWKILRKKMITASNVGAICKLRPSTSCVSTLFAILYDSVKKTPAMQFGIDNESIARQQLQEKLQKDFNSTKITISSTGMFIAADKELYFLGATPDGGVNDNEEKIMKRESEKYEGGLVEIKCIYSARKSKIYDAYKANNGSLKQIFKDETLQEMKKSCNYYYQVQTQLKCADKSYCIFCTWTPCDLHYIIIKRDDDFINNTILPKVKKFWEDCVSVEIINKNKTNHKQIEDPSYITAAKKEIEKKKLLKLSSQTSDTKSNKNAIVKNSFDKDGLEIVDEFECNLLDIEEYVASSKFYYESRVLEFNAENVLLLDFDIIDDMLDHVVRILNIQFPIYHTENVGYSSHPDFTSSLPESANFCIQIIGGSLSLHWRTIFFEKKDNEESVISVYDSLNCSTDEGVLSKSLCDFELRYIQKRFPKKCLLILKDFFFL